MKARIENFLSRFISPLAASSLAQTATDLLRQNAAVTKPLVMRADEVIRRLTAKRV